MQTPKPPFHTKVLKCFDTGAGDRRQLRVLAFSPCPCFSNQESWIWLPLNSQQQLQVYSKGNQYAFQALLSPSPKHLVAFNEITVRFIDPALTPEISGKWHQQPQGRTELSALSSPAISFSSRNKMLLTGYSKADRQKPLDFIFGFVITWAKQATF